MKKILAIILTIATILSVFVLPTAAETTEQTTGPKEIDFSYVQDVSDKTITVDGIDSEGWSDMDYSLLKYSYNGGEVAPEGQQPKVRVATDGENIYVYYETYGFKSEGSIGSTLFCYVRFGDYYKYATRLTTYLSENVGYIAANDHLPPTSDAKAITYGEGASVVVKEGTDKTVLEASIKIPRDLEEAVTNGVYDDLKMTLIERYAGSSVGPGCRTATADITSMGADTEMKIAPLSTAYVPYVSRVAADAVTIDGERKSGEGWSESRYFELTEKTGTDVASITAPPKVYLSTDGEYLNVFYESYKDGWKDNNAQLLFHMRFSSAADDNLRVAFNFKDGIETRLSEFYYYDYNGSEKTEIDYKNKEGAIEYDIVISDDKVVAEFKVKLPDAEIEILNMSNSTIEIAAFEKHVHISGNHGLRLQYGANFIPTINVSLPTAPISNDKPRYVGAQSRTNPESDLIDVRFLAAIGDYADYKSIGFDLVLNGEHESNEEATRCYVVYSSIVANGEDVYATNYGGKYFFAFTISGLEKGNTYTFAVSGYTQKAGADKMSSEAVTVKVTVADDGTVKFG